MALHLILPSLARTIIPTVLQLDYYVTTIVTAASNKSASLVICKTKSEYFDPRRGQLVSNQSSPSRVIPHILVAALCEQGDRAINFIGSTQPEEAVTFYHFNFNCHLSSHVGVGVGIQGDPQATGFNRRVRERLQDTPRRHPKLART